MRYPKRVAKRGATWVMLIALAIWCGACTKGGNGKFDPSLKYGVMPADNWYSDIDVIEVSDGNALNGYEVFRLENMMSGAARFQHDIAVKYTAIEVNERRQIKRVKQDNLRDIQRVLSKPGLVTGPWLFEETGIPGGNQQYLYIRKADGREWIGQWDNIFSSRFYDLWLTLKEIEVDHQFEIDTTMIAKNPEPSVRTRRILREAWARHSGG